MIILCILLLGVSTKICSSQSSNRRVGRFQEVFAWRQLTYEIDGYPLIKDRLAAEDVYEAVRNKRQSDNVFFNQPNEPNRNKRPPKYQNMEQPNNNPPMMGWRPDSFPSNINFPGLTTNSPVSTSTTKGPTDSQNSTDESNRYFVQYNNVPMGVEKVGNRLFITVPRRRYGIPSTLNCIDLSRRSNTLSPPLTPYPNLRDSRALTSVYRTKADACGRLWMVDTGMLEIPNNRQQLQPPAIVIFDLNTDTEILRYPFKSSDLVSARTPAGLASITVDLDENDCNGAYAYVPDLATYGLIVFSLRERDSWRLSNNYFNFNPLAGNMNIGGQSFQWNDGIFSITLSNRQQDGCRTAYFHPLVSFQEFSISTCVLRNQSASSDTSLWTNFKLVAERGENSQSTIHSFHDATQVIFFAEVGRNAISCWKIDTNSIPQGSVLAQDAKTMMYPSDLHVTDDEVWVMANSMPRFIYSTLDTSEFNFYIYRGNVQELISGTACDTLYAENNRFTERKREPFLF